MQVVRFTKFWADLSVRELGERAVELGYDGLDLTVRPGYTVNPNNVAEELPPAARLWESMGVGCQMISASGDLIDPAAGEAQRLFQAAGEAGVPRIKIGYFRYTAGQSFGAALAAARRALEGFEALSRRTGVQTVCHTHSGMCLGSNCAGLRDLLDGRDPAHVGAYPDLGHLAINGEDVLMALPMVRERLAAIGAKDGRHVRDERPNPRAAYTRVMVPLGQGAAEWRDALSLLHEWRFEGPISVHTEYTADRAAAATGPDAEREAEALRRRGEKEDLAFLRGLWREVSAAG